MNSEAPPQESDRYKTMGKTFIGIVGILLFVFGIFLSNTLRNGERSASSLDGKKTVFGMISDEGPPPCSWDAKSPERVMADNKSQAVVIEVKNTDKKTCESILSLQAPSFETSPPKDEQKITVPAGKAGSLSWILTPRKPGTYQIAVSDILNTKIFGITVTNMFGLTATQAKTFSFFSGLLGPMLTVPWWVDKWFQRKKKQEVKKDGDENKAG